MMLLDSVDVNVKTEVQLRKAKKEEIYEDAMMDLYIGLRTQQDSNLKREEEKKFDRTVAKVKAITKKDTLKLVESYLSS